MDMSPRRTRCSCTSAIQAGPALSLLLGSTPSSQFTKRLLRITVQAFKRKHQRKYTVGSSADCRTADASLAKPFLLREQATKIRDLFREAKSASYTEKSKSCIVRRRETTF